MNNTCKQCQYLHEEAAAFCVKCGYPMEGEPLDLQGKRAGNYQLVTRIGGGGFGEVYRAEHVELGNPFAVKVLHPRLSSDPAFVERFRHEAMVLAGLRHENVVQVVDFGEDSGLGFYLVMEWIEGRTLHRYWKQKRVLPLGQIFALFSQLLDALQLAHEQGIVHRDMKPENLMMTRGSRGRMLLKIVDFGIAKIFGRSLNVSDPVNKSGTAIGTPYYMSPEQASGKDFLVDHRSDLYACGVILAELLSGRRLFKTKDPKEILRHQIEKPPPTLAELSPKRPYPESLQRILDRALAKDPANRYSSASLFYEEIAEVMRSEGIQPQEDESQWEAGNTSTNLLALVGGGSPPEDAEVALPAEVHSLQSTGSGFRGQKATPSQTGAQAVGLDDNGEPPLLLDKRSRLLAMWGSLGLGLLLLLVIGVFAFRTPSEPTPKPQPRPLVSLPLPPPSSLGEPKRPGSPASPNPNEGGLSDASAPEANDREAPSPAPIPIPSDTREPSERRKPKVRGRRGRKAPKERRHRPSKHQTNPVVSEATERLVSLTLNTKPAGVQVFVNGRAIGQTPLTLRTPFGKEASIRLHKQGYIEKKFSWNAKSDGSQTFALIEDL